MFVEERLDEIQTAPREACIMKAEARALVEAYRARTPGLKITKSPEDGVWIHFESPSGKHAAINVGCLAAERGPLVAEVLNEWQASLAT